MPVSIPFVHGPLYAERNLRDEGGVLENAQQLSVSFIGDPGAMSAPVALLGSSELCAGRPSVQRPDAMISAGRGMVSAAANRQRGAAKPMPADHSPRRRQSTPERQAPRLQPPRPVCRGARHIRDRRPCGEQDCTRVAAFPSVFVSGWFAAHGSSGITVYQNVFLACSGARAGFRCHAPLGTHLYKNTYFYRPILTPGNASTIHCRETMLRVIWVALGTFVVGHPRIPLPMESSGID